MKLINKRFRLLILVVIGIVFLSVYIVINEPISDRLEEDVLQKFQLSAYNKYRVLEENLLNIENNAHSLSSRTEIKRVLSEYLSGETSLEELIDYTAPRYEEGAAIYDSLKSAGRFTIDRHLLHTVGEYENIEKYVDWALKESFIEYIPEESLVVVQSPIKNKSEEILGFDIILADLGPLIGQLEEGGFTLSFIGDLRGEEVVVYEGKVISYIDSSILGESVAISIDETSAFESIKNLKTYIYIRYILLMLVVFIIIQFFGVTYIKKFIISQNDLKQKAEESEKRLRITLDVAGEGLWDWDFEEGLVHHNKRWCEIMGGDKTTETHKIDEFVGLVHPEDDERVRDGIAKAISGEENFFSEYRMILRNGRTIWVKDRGTIIRDDEGKPVRMIGSMEDTTQKKQAEKDLFLEKEVLKSTLLSVGDGVISTDMDGVIKVFNPAASDLTDWTQEEAIGETLNQVFKLKDENLDILINNEDILDVKNDSINGDYKVALLQSVLGKEYSIIYSIAPIRLPKGELMGFVIVFRNVSEIVERQKKIEYLSFNDELSDLYNRRYIEDAIKRLDGKRNLPLSIMVIDINNMKLTNDIFGHEMGDKVIRQTADLLKKIFRADDIVARTGGDEFNILLPNTSKDKVEIIKQRIKEKAKFSKIDFLPISLSIGYAVKTKEEERIEDIIRIADSNMYDDKNTNKDRIRNDLILDFLNENISKFEAEKDHNEIVSILSGLLYKELGKSQKEVEDFCKAVELHDIGKVVIPEKILNRNQGLNEEEYEIMKRHPQASYEIMRILDDHNLFKKAILYHHERIDGRGYPEGLKGHEIPLESKIISIADAYESMTSDRSYKNPMTREEAILELRKNAGTQFDSDLVEIFIEKVLPSFNK